MGSRHPAIWACNGMWPSLTYHLSFKSCGNQCGSCWQSLRSYTCCASAPGQAAGKSRHPPSSRTTAHEGHHMLVMSATKLSTDTRCYIQPPCQRIAGRNAGVDLVQWRGCSGAPEARRCPCPEFAAMPGGGAGAKLYCGANTQQTSHACAHPSVPVELVDSSLPNHAVLCCVHLLLSWTMSAALVAMSCLQQFQLLLY